ncbi:ubiquinone biosynthesis hydroxylase, UbiH/UbiF/VisC/COQ6 [Salinisphaera sp. PC39]|uniref:2-octaprenyl-6-methoxyphenyl hydroxylase n=1 Tax=Salinisphaera sp. PC39 TaxID=1304156 RepID=UPI0033422081
MNEHFDVLIIGGGLAGASFACSLSGSGLSVAMVEAVPFGAAGQPSYDERTTALAWGTRRLFEDLGLWRGLTAEAAPIRRLHVSQRGRFGVTRVDCADYGVEALGYVVPNRVLGRVLSERLTELDDVTMIAPARFDALERDAEGVTVTVRGGDDAPRTLRARLLVGADGARSAVRDALGVEAEVRDYGQRAVVTTVTPGYDHTDTAYERFLPDGPLALLPRTPETCAVVWALPEAEATRVTELTDDDFLAELQAAFGHRLGELRAPGERLTYPLKRLVAATTVTARAALVGSAGHHLHPAAAQGFNLAMRDVAVLARELRHAAAAGIDPGDADVLTVWREARAADQRRVSDFTDRIVRLFSNRVPGLGAARSLGLVGLELLPAVKDDMARRSMGLAAAGTLSAGQGAGSSK